MADIPRFEHAENGITRFPPNVEQITVKRESGRVWLVARRNETTLRFPLELADREHLIELLKEQVDG